jgi:hypothetical protein
MDFKLTRLIKLVVCQFRTVTRFFLAPRAKSKAPVAASGNGWTKARPTSVKLA